ncbi:hypothetical protein B0H66DRAFT_603705 [Apodospora peruviana]|uniref:Uncharacterized protein n=1 Tax=Apodospora peruviana TaxID=516989 RepID=A0AAE0M5Y4_9PEZI|nr:hypothetical protein B0H66DRAFT_486834 [Apodospora peruviana]KAK3319144.1 hypothetical protein B0H66DRAFT_603705 [Apodospora peruviana]
MVDKIITPSGPDFEVREQIAEGFWKTPSKEVRDLDAYFNYYTKQCEIMALWDGGCFTSVKTHKDILRIAKVLKGPIGRERVSCRFLNGKNPTMPDGKQDGRAIDLAARLLLMIEFGFLEHVAPLVGRPIEWSHGTIQSHIARCFPNAPVLGHEGVKLGSIFNAMNLEKIAGVEIVWTDNLVDHLHLLNNDKQVAVFNHASFLLRQQSDESLYPRAFLDETVQTIKLLFPKWDEATKPWYTQKVASRSTRDLDPKLIEVGHLSTDERQIEKFQYWHDRLVMLKQVFDESEPSSLRQWWIDRRKRVQWFTFWVAILVLILTVVFGIIQSVEGGIQAYYTIHQKKS